MRRFEQLLAKPVRFWELDVTGNVVRTREGAPGQPALETTTTLASPTAATAHAEAAIAAHKRDGYVEIKRIAPAARPQERVERREQFDWVDGYVRRRRYVLQSDLRVAWWDVRLTRTDEVQDVPTTEQRLADLDAADAAYLTAVADARTRAKSRAPHTLGATSTRRDRVASHPELEAQCTAAADDDPTPWMVLADWLIAEGDLRGEIAALAAVSHEQAEAAIDVHYGHLPHRDTDRLAYTLRHGFVRRVRLGSNERVTALIAEVLASPLCRFVDAIELDLRTSRDGRNAWQPAVEAVLASPRAGALRELVLDSHDHVDIMLRNQRYGDLGFAWDSLPVLERLDLRSAGSGRLGNLDALPHLATLIRAPQISSHELAELGTLTLASLEHLELHVQGRDPEHFEFLFDGRYPRLGHLGLRGATLTRETIEMLASSPLVARLYSLDLAGGSLDDATAKVLASHAKYFRHLACLDLSSNLMRDNGVAIKRVLDNVLVGGQRWQEVDDRYDDVDE